MKRQIVIDEETGMVETRQITVESKCPLSEHVKTLQEQMSHEPIFLPYVDRGTACFSAQRNKRFFLMYLSPEVKRTILYNSEDGTEHKQYDVYFPHSYIGIFFRGGAIEGGYAYVSDKKLTAPNQMLGRMPVPNTDESAKICEGNRAAWPTHHDPTVSAMSYLDFFLKSNFTAHIMSHFHLLPDELKSDTVPDRGEWKKAQKEVFEKWQKESEKGYEHILGLKWQTEWTVDEVVKDFWEPNRNQRRRW